MKCRTPHDGGAIKSLLIQLGVRASLRFVTDHEERRGRTGETTMDATWCFLMGMMAGFIPSFAVLAFIVLGFM